MTGAQLKPSFSGSRRASTTKSIVSPFSTAMPFKLRLGARSVHRPRRQLAMPARDDPPADAVAVRHRGLAVPQRALDAQLSRRPG